MSVELGPWANSLIATTLISIAPIFIVFLVPCLSDEVSNTRKQALKTLVSFAVGGLLGDVFLHLLPHSTSTQPVHNHSHDESSNEESPHESHESHETQFLVGVYILLGMLVFFLIEKYTRLAAASGHVHGFLPDAVSNSSSSSLEEGKRKKEDTNHEDTQGTNSGSNKDSLKIGGLLNIIADASHNFTDGMAIAASFLVGKQVGMSTTIAVLFHEIPHEIGDYAILMQSGFTMKNAMMVQFFTAIGAYLGTFFGLLTGGEGSSFHWILPFTAGGFIYLATVDVLPDLLETTSVKQSIREICAMIAGGVMMGFLSTIE